MRGSSVAVAFAAAFLFSGCADGATNVGQGAPVLEPTIEVEATKTTGVIRGVVVDEAIVPLAGVRVAVATVGGTLETETNTGGGFGFEGLEPGTYFVRTERFGYDPVQQSVEVEAGVSEPPYVKILMARIAGLVVGVDVFVWEGFLQCGTNNLAACAAPNSVSGTVCGYSNRAVCLGELTDDEFGTSINITANASIVQSEMVWKTTQPVGESMSLILRYGTQKDWDEGFYSGQLNRSTGPSPVMADVEQEELNEREIGSTNVYLISIFTGASPQLAPVPFGAAVQQTFKVFTHAFYGYLPPDDWRFSADGEPPRPE